VFVYVCVCVCVFVHIFTLEPAPDGQSTSFVENTLIRGGVVPRATLMGSVNTITYELLAIY
jgi:hypothetical protein